MSKAAVLLAGCGHCGVHISMGGKFKRGPQGFGGKHKTKVGAGGMIGLDGPVAIRNAALQKLWSSARAAK
jgi:hypothetical protein